MQHLVDRRPTLTTEQVIGSLVPPPQFAAARFETYIPGEPSQEAALATLQEFASQVDRPTPRRGLLGRRLGPALPPGVYLDGGFGTGKTHLLASLWHAVTVEPKAYATFVELTSLVGLLGFGQTVEALAPMRLLCVDEFELDDPGDTVLVSTLLQRLVERGVKLASTSNTQPEDLGAGRFAADAFLREIQGLRAHFTVVPVDGPDYRHRGLTPAPAPSSSAVVQERCARGTCDDWAALLEHLATLHPSRYGALVDGDPVVGLTDVAPLTSQDVALRLVVLVDRLYDRNIPVVGSGVPFDQVFTPEMLSGPYRKKFARSVSRLGALARLGATAA